MTNHQSEIIIVGAGIAGLIATYELLNAGKKVLLIDRDVKKEIGGLAKWAFGGMFFVDTPHQRKSGIKDSFEQAKKDWFSYAEFEENEKWGKKWAEQYLHLCTDHGYKYLQKQGIDFFRVVNWAERGMDGNGNSLPRFHMIWGTGWELVQVFSKKVLHHPKAKNLTLLFQHKVTDLIKTNGKITGVQGLNESTNQLFEARSERTIIATGGINGSIQKVKDNWDPTFGMPPNIILNGAHKFALGDLHEATQAINGSVVNLEKQWNYAAGIRHFKPRKENHGLSLVPCKSALWLNSQGKRIGPRPLITSYDTRYLVKQICKEPKQFSWMILNRKIALKEFAISGSEFNHAIRKKQFFRFVSSVLFGNKALYNEMVEKAEDFIIAGTLEELTEKMNALEGNNEVSFENLNHAVLKYDQEISNGKPYKDEQIIKILQAREYRGDRARTCNLQSINDPKAGPFVAIRSYILSRKSLGGIQTNLESKVLTNPNRQGQQETIPGLYAIGEAAGFGGGGMHGIRSLEGTFLGGCVITAQSAAKSILNQNWS